MMFDFQPDIANPIKVELQQPGRLTKCTLPPYITYVLLFEVTVCVHVPVDRLVKKCHLIFQATQLDILSVQDLNMQKSIQPAGEIKTPSNLLKI